MAASRSPLRGRCAAFDRPRSDSAMAYRPRGPVEGPSDSGSLFGGGHVAPRRVRYWNGVCHHSAASPRGSPRAIPRYRSLGGPAAAPLQCGGPPALPPPRLQPGGRRPGPVCRCAGGVKRSGGRARRGGATLSKCQPLWRFRPSDAAWKQRLGLITLVLSLLLRPGVAGRSWVSAPGSGGWARQLSLATPLQTPGTFKSLVEGTPVAFGSIFFFLSPHIPGKVAVARRRRENVRAPNCFLPDRSSRRGLHKPPRSHASLPRFRVRNVDTVVGEISISDLPPLRRLLAVDPGLPAAAPRDSAR